MVACTSDGDKGELAEVSDIVALGEAGLVTFSSADGLSVTADYYPNEDATKLIILCHQAGFSRGEYKDIAKVLLDSGYACLAIDQRSGKEVHGIVNETAKLAAEKGLSQEYMDARPDVEAAINFVAQNSEKEIYLWGSSYSASLALIVANVDPRVKKVIAFSPGEYFSNPNSVRSLIVGLTKPCFITGGNAEYDMMTEKIVMAVPSNNLVAVKPEGLSDHGSKTLWSTSPSTKATYKKLFRFLEN